MNYYMKKILLVFCTSFLLFGCKNTVNNQQLEIETVKVDVENFDEKLSLVDLIDSISFISLAAECEEALFKQINKCLFIGDKIYIMDYFGNSTVTVWENKGNFLFKVGKQGQGPGEYHKITDFDVSNGKIYLLDSSQRKILCYDSVGAFVDEFSYRKKIEGVNDLIVTSDSNFLLGMDVELNDSDQVILTDSKFDIKQNVLSFDKGTTRNHLNIGCFKRCGKNIIYHYPVSNDVYIFDNVGQLVQKYNISFGQMIPSDIKADYREISKQRRVRKFCYFYETPFMNEQLLLSTVFYNSKKAMLCADLGKHTFIKDVYSGELSFSLSNFNFPIYMDENQVVCLLDQMSYDYFDEKSKKVIDSQCRASLENGEVVLVVYHLK